MVTAVYAQDGLFRRAPKAASVTSTSATPSNAATTKPKVDPQVQRTATTSPAPINSENAQAPPIALPNDPIEPWLLTKEVGPFLVLAKTFRGPEAERYALALAMELRREYKLPAFILRTKDFPHGSLFRNVPPMAPSYVNKANLTEPERVRSYDEAAVLVGNEKTLADSEKLLHMVRKLKPKTLKAMPTVYEGRAGHGLSTAIRTTNPYQPTQNLFPGGGGHDPFVKGLNQGPYSVYKCPGRYTLQVAQFNGRATFNPSSSENNNFGENWLKKSPLITAHDDAEELAGLLTRHPKVVSMGAKPYVYHDRTSSRVLVGSFSSPNDPSAVELRNVVLNIPSDFLKLPGKWKAGYNGKAIIAPATVLTDLDDPTNPIKDH